MFRKDKTKNFQSFSLECNVNEIILNEMINIASDSTFFVEICGIDKRNKLVGFINNSNILNVFLINKDNETDILLALNRGSFCDIADLLINCAAEVLVLYIQYFPTSFEQFIFNKPISNNPQKEAIIKGLCSFICTWVTNENRLYFHFDSSIYKDEYIEELKSLLVE